MEERLREKDLQFRPEPRRPCSTKAVEVKGLSSEEARTSSYARVCRDLEEMGTSELRKRVRSWMVSLLLLRLIAMIDLPFFRDEKKQVVIVDK